MKKKVVCTVLVSMLLLFTIISTRTQSAKAEDTTVIYVDPPISYATLGRTFSVNVSISNVIGLYEYEFKLSYDTTVLNIVKATIQPFLNEPNLALRDEINEDQGWYWLMMSSLFPAAAKNGSGPLVTLEFTVMDPSNCTLDLSDTILANVSGETILHSEEDGYVEPKPMESDVNNDGVVDIIDGIIIGVAFGTEPDDPNWNPHADLNEDRIIDTADIIIWVAHFGLRARKVIRVPEDYSTIQQAIDAAAPGATISIAPRISSPQQPYNETLVINKTLTLLGRRGSSPEFDGGGSGIAITLLSGASGSTVAGIVMTNYDKGIMIDNASECKIYDNIMSSMDICGVAFEGEGAVDNQIYSNIFQASAVAVNLNGFSTSNTIYDNAINLNDVGLDLEESNGNIIYANTISENTVGINMTGSNDNTIYQNNFVNNTVQVYILAPAENTWDIGYSSSGNYWSDHNPPDVYSGPHQNRTGRDRIGDTPCVIDEDNVDRYPLIYPYGYFPSPDVDDDKTVDIVDIVICALVFGSKPGYPDWNLIADLDQDGIVDILDVVIVAIHFGETA